MLGLGSSVTKGGAGAKTIVTDSLVLKHNYNRSSVQPVSSGAAYFVESNTDYISVSDAASLSFDACSFSAWIYVSDATDFPIIGKGVYNDTAEYQLKVQSDDKIHFWVADESVVSCHIGRATPTITSYENQWIHVVGTYDGGTASSGLKIYINGVQVDDANDEGNAGSFVAMENLAANVEIGKYSSTYGDGYMCNVGVWSEALTQPQIKSIMRKDYAALSASEKTNLVSWWNLDSVIDSAVYANSSGSTSVYDNHHGGNETLGANIVTGYDLGSGFSEWAVYDPEDGGTTISTDGSIITVNVKDGDPNDNQGARCEITSSLVVGKTYEVTADLWLGTYVPNPAGEFVIYLAGQGIATTLTTTRTTYTRYITATSTSDLIFHQSDADENEGTFFISNVSVKLVNGNTGTLA